MPNRFYLPDLPDAGVAVLDGSEAHHLLHVLRARPGDVVELFSGDGRVARAEVATVRRSNVDLRILDAHCEDPSPRRIVLATAVPKGDRFDWLIEKATELGVARLVPLVTARSSVDPRQGKLDKLRQTVIAACKQSGRNHLLELAPVTSWADFIAGSLVPACSFLAHPCPEATPIGRLPLGSLATAVFAIGPEGGFTDDEVSMALARGVQPISLGLQILRIETAALAVAAVALQA